MLSKVTVMAAVSLLISVAVTVIAKVEPRCLSLLVTSQEGVGGGEIKESYEAVLNTRGVSPSL